ncbi:hypothetical protein [Saccharopolyspora spinosa]|uniref:Uncharacterized protein n=1 Tax=Saccharopolyspora spinosa TaxID=60894 RepID=A0A2N3XXD2_SACSN|nr:hypothetical protein [Saccharopolyspora spinosa]PKW15328.1 hypothetical protein A8926_3022 [Saccharopolyspora spinosa]
MSKQVWAEEHPSGNYSGRYRHPITRSEERAGSFPSEDEALAAARKAMREITRIYNGDPDLSPVSGAPTLAEYAHEAIARAGRDTRRSAPCELPHVRQADRRRHGRVAHVRDAVPAVGGNPGQS